MALVPVDGRIDQVQEQDGDGQKDLAVEARKASDCRSRPEFLDIRLPLVALRSFAVQGGMVKEDDFESVTLQMAKVLP